MQLEDWTELIKNVLGPSAFKTVGALALRALYQREVIVTDGTDDGGADAWIKISETPTGRIPVQFHSGRSVKWHAKLLEDVNKRAVQDAPARRLFFMCAQTPTEDAVRQQKVDLEVSHGILVEIIDARAIATVALRDPAVFASLRAHLPESPAAGADNPPSVADEAQLAFVFFHDESGSFRKEVARSVLAVSLVHAREPADKEEVLDRALARLGGEKHLRGLLRQELTALVTSGDAIQEEGRVRPSADLVRRVQGEWDAGALAKERLREDCVAALEKRVQPPERRQEAVDAIFDDLGFLLRRSVAERLPGDQRNAAVRFNAAERRLAEMLKPKGGTARDALRAIIDVASRSVYGRALASAELFVQMTRRELGELARALTGRDRIEVMLDTSVAMPMLCAKLDRMAEGWVTSEVALELHTLLVERGVKIVVPHLYLEEMAAHLIAAARDYATLAGEPGLARSENFFVAHYHAVAEARQEAATPAGFEEFLHDLGLPDGWERNDDFQMTLRKIERALTTLLRQYQIEINRVTFTDGAALKEEPARPQIVLDHDRRVAAWLDDRARSSSEGLVLCSQDRWLLSAVSEREWLAVDPAALVDLLPMTRPLGAVAPLISLRELAARMNDASAERAARVWDMLAGIEGPRLADRELLRQARAFKDAWLTRERSAERPVAAEWARFKERLRLDD
ncbi:hypothetical protein [Chondromyces apiculatus]|uniref:Restriction endonuclease type IV Mrr domain-containing protein n=1 Tax=Chondromyces apiculatus DSM 436 TaxID=1192034 RepID=A0A017SZ75_9BACT|nr:hypothetical protein [Chondromyces apiculatus]EYF01581.1 Hypothetical protein CAP_8021 [Chondromyces apiculatus DSM 436]